MLSFYSLIILLSLAENPAHRKAYAYILNNTKNTAIVRTLHKSNIFDGNNISDASSFKDHPLLLVSHL